MDDGHTTKKDLVTPVAHATVPDQGGQQQAERITENHRAASCTHPSSVMRRRFAFDPIAALTDNSKQGCLAVTACTAHVANGST